MNSTSRRGCVISITRVIEKLPNDELVSIQDDIKDGLGCTTHQKIHTILQEYYPTILFVI